MSVSSLQSGTVDDATQAADKFLASCVQATLADAPLPPWPFGSTQQSSLPEADLADALISRAEFHGIALLLTYRGTQGNDWPSPVMAQLTQLARLSGLWEELHRPRITGLIEVLADRGVASIVLKGSALAYLHYPDPALRRRGDTDLLIRPEDLDTTRAALREAGWISPPPSRGLYFQESWDIDCGLGMLHTLDLHWHPTDRPVIQKVLRPEDYWASTRLLPRLSPRAAAPDPVIMLVHGAINQFWHETRGILVEGERVVGGRRLPPYDRKSGACGLGTAGRFLRRARCRRHRPRRVGGRAAGYRPCPARWLSRAVAASVRPVADHGVHPALRPIEGYPRGLHGGG
jgi:hypothetical protein